MPPHWTAHTQRSPPPANSRRMTEQALKAEEEALPGLESSAKEQAGALKSAEQQTARAKEELKAAAPTLQKVRSLDQKLADQKKAVSEGG